MNEAAIITATLGTVLMTALGFSYLIGIRKFSLWLFVPSAIVIATVFMSLPRTMLVIRYLPQIVLFFAVAHLGHELCSWLDKRKGARA